MKKIRVLSLILALIVVFTMFAGCGQKDNNKEKPDAGEANSTNSVETNNNGTGEENNNNNGETNKEEKPKDRLAEGLTAEKIGTIENDDISTSKVGIIYRDDNGMYGIMTLDGKNDTGAKYTECTPVGDFFEVTTIKETSVDDIDSLNCFGVVDANGKEIIPMKYALVEKLNDRYIKVYEATEKTTNEDESLLNYNNGAVRFKGKWYIYDMVSEKVLEGVYGTNKYETTTYGNLIEYVTDAEEIIIVNEKGEKVPEGAEYGWGKSKVYFNNGYYNLVKDNAGAVYNSNHEKLFDYALDGFIPYKNENDYIWARKYDNGYTYVLMDTTGKTVSVEFTSVPDVYGDLIFAEGKVYDFDGETVFEGSFNQIFFEKQFGDVYCLKNDKEYTLIKKDGTVLYQGAEDEVIYFDMYNRFTIKKKVEDKNMYYSFADKDFTLEAKDYGGAPWLVEVAKPNFIYDLADTISGKTIINGYKGYKYINVPDEAIYVYAKKADGGYDIYVVK